MYAKLAVALLVVSASVGCVIGNKFQAPVGTVPENAGVLAITCNVKGADVYIDGAVVGTITDADKRQEIVIPSGEHALVLKKFGYKDSGLKISLVAGAINTIDVLMERLPTEIVDLPADK